MQKNTHKFSFFMNIGFFAGLIWGGAKLIEFGLKFTTISPGLFIEPFYKHVFIVSWLGMALGLVSFIVFSMIAAGIYGMMLRKVRGPWLGMIYGIVWWVILYLVMGPWLEMVPKVWLLDWNTIVSDICLFLMWGLFIGYSIAMEFTDEESREPENQK